MHKSSQTFPWPDLQSSPRINSARVNCDSAARRDIQAARVI